MRHVTFGTRNFSRARTSCDSTPTSGAFLITKYGVTHCAGDNGHHDWNVGMSPHTSDKSGKVKVTLQHQLSNGSWAGIGSEWSTLSTYVDDDYLRITDTGSNLSFGGDGWGSLAQLATGSAQVEWEFSGGQIRPHLTGTLHAGNTAGECARMRIDYYADDGELGLGAADTNSYSDYLHTVYGGEVCANDKSHYPWSVDRRDYSDNRIRQIRVALETLDDGTWTTVGNVSSMFGT